MVEKLAQENRKKGSVFLLRLWKLPCQLSPPSKLGQ